jgi:hypothetical protein
MPTRHLIRLCATAWAALLDVAVGAAIVTVMLQLHASILEMCAGSLLALLPDYIHVGWLWRVMTGRKVTFDHHNTWSHRPVLILPAAALVCGLIGGPLWAFIALLCVSWHFLHDSPPLGDGHLNWGWLPFGWGTPDPKDRIDHEEWLVGKWYTNSPRFVVEVVPAVILLFLISVLTGYTWLIVAPIGLAVAALYWPILVSRYRVASQAA